MLGLFKYFEYDVDKTDTGRAPLAASVSMPEIKDGVVLAGTPMPEPYLLADDPAPLEAFRAEEENLLTTYGVADKNAGTLSRIPDRARSERPSCLKPRDLPAKGGSEMSTRSSILSGFRPPFVSGALT